MKKRSEPFQELSQLLTSLLPPENNYIPVVTEETQQKVIEQRDENTANESFYFVFNLLTCAFDYVRGVEKWLGYSSREFTVQQYLSCIHPGQSIQFNMLAHSMYKILCKGIFRLQFATQRYISLVALKHYNGEYIVFKKTTSVFQYDENNRLLQQLNEFTKIETYNATPLKPRILETNGMQKADFERLVFQMTMKSFMEKKFFSETEFKILKCYANDENISSRQIALQLGIVKETADVYNRRILQKARDTFTHLFSSAKEVAVYLKKEKILE